MKQVKRKLRSVFSSLLARLILLVVAALVLFFGGYQLAVYQEQNNDTLLPHINFGDNPTASPPLGCFMGRLPEDCCPPRGIGCESEDKPVIYLYPTRPEDVTVKLSYVTGFHETVPAYNPATGWQVLAHPDGTLVTVTNGQTYPYLVWEGKPARLKFDMSQGFVVAGQNTKSFLEQELTKIGLNQNETNAFLAFWLPKMQHNTFNLIHFAGTEYTELAPLTITPKPDSLLRVNMAFEPLQKPETVTPQIFPAFHRNGFTVVEWGGTEIQ